MMPNDEGDIHEVACLALFRAVTNQRLMKNACHGEVARGKRVRKPWRCEKMQAEWYREACELGMPPIAEHITIERYAGMVAQKRGERFGLVLASLRAEITRKTFKNKKSETGK